MDEFIEKINHRPTISIPFPARWMKNEKKTTKKKQQKSKYGKSVSNQYLIIDLHFLFCVPNFLCKHIQIVNVWFFVYLLPRCVQSSKQSCNIERGESISDEIRIGTSKRIDIKLKKLIGTRPRSCNCITCPRPSQKLRYIDYVSSDCNFANGKKSSSKLNHSHGKYELFNGRFG